MRQVMEYLESKGIDPSWVLALVLALIIFSERGNIKNRKNLDPDIWKLHRTIVVGSIIMIIMDVIVRIFAGK